MQTLALISGLVGALASGGLAFAVRLFLDRKSQRDSERRLAYVYLVSVTEYVAIEIAVVQFVKAYVSADAIAKLESTDGAYELPHAISAFLSEAILKHDALDPKRMATVRQFGKYVEAINEAAKESRLTPEQLSKLPRSLVVASAEYQAHHMSLALLFELWVDLISSEDRTWVTPSWFQDQWRSLVRFASAARRLRSELIVYGAATKEEGHQMLVRRALAMLEIFSTQMSDKAKLEVARTAAKKFLEEER